MKLKISASTVRALVDARAKIAENPNGFLNDLLAVNPEAFAQAYLKFSGVDITPPEKVDVVPDAQHEKEYITDIYDFRNREWFKVERDRLITGNSYPINGVGTFTINSVRDSESKVIFWKNSRFVMNGASYKTLCNYVDGGMHMQAAVIIRGCTHMSVSHSRLIAKKMLQNVGPV